MDRGREARGRKAEEEGPRCAIEQQQRAQQPTKKHDAVLLEAKGVAGKQRPVRAAVLLQERLQLDCKGRRVLVCVQTAGCGRV